MCTSDEATKEIFNLSADSNSKGSNKNDLLSDGRKTIQFLQLPDSSLECVAMPRTCHIRKSPRPC